MTHRALSPAARAGGSVRLSDEPETPPTALPAPSNPAKTARAPAPGVKPAKPEEKSDE